MSEPNRIELLEPWFECPRGLENQLQKELSEAHVLFGVEAVAVARRQENDDVLFYLPKHEIPFSVVHLTWDGRQKNPQFPHAEFFVSFEDFAENRMQLDREEFENYS